MYCRMSLQQLIPVLPFVSIIRHKRTNPFIHRKGGIKRETFNVKFGTRRVIVRLGNLFNE
jgi:hypothetical protein